MADIPQHRETLGEVQYPPAIEAALKEVTELPDEPEAQADFFDKVQEALSTRLSDDS